MIQAKEISCETESFAGLSIPILQSGKSIRFKARGQSMLPLLKDGDRLTVSPIESARIPVGSIVLFQKTPGRIMVHRVVRREKIGSAFQYLLRGDNASVKDGWILREDILGKLTGLERDGKYFGLRSWPFLVINHLMILKIFYKNYLR